MRHPKTNEPRSSLYYDRNRVQNNRVSTRGKRLLGMGALLLTAGAAFVGCKLGELNNQGTALAVAEAEAELQHEGKVFAAIGGTAGSCEQIALGGMVIDESLELLPQDIEFTLTVACGEGDYAAVSSAAAEGWNQVAEAKQALNGAIEESEYDSYEMFLYATGGVLAAAGAVCLSGMLVYEFYK